MAPLVTAGWAHNGSGEIVNRQTRSPRGIIAYFKHAQELQAHDVLRTKVEGGGAYVGFATESYDVEKHVETEKSIAWVNLCDGTTVIRSEISQDGEDHLHPRHLKDYIPKTLPLRLKDYIPKTVPYDLALRINKDGNVPQIQFNEDGEWHDFAPDKAALKAGPWFPFLQLNSAATRLSDHSVNRPKPTKSAGAGKL